MKNRLLIWIWMLCKRLYKKPTFLFLLLLIPVITFSYSSMDETDSGIVTICLASEDPGDPLSQILIEELAGSSQLIRFVVCDSAEEAEHTVVIGNADACWIFKDRLQERIISFADSWSSKDAFVRVIERRQSLPLLIAREKLGGLVYHVAAEPFYLKHIRTYIPELDDVSEEKLLEYYHSVNLNGTLFEFSTIYSGDEVHQMGKGSFLFAPVRGLLAIVVVLSGLAASMYYIQDREKGTFSWVPERYSSFLEMAYQLITVFNVLLMTVVSLALSGLSVSLGRECILGVLFAFTVAGFSMVLRILCRKVSVIGVMVPFLLVAMLAICPVFYDLGKLRILQFLFPPTFFITGAYNSKYLLYAFCYFCASILVYSLISKLRKK